MEVLTQAVSRQKRKLFESLRFKSKNYQNQLTNTMNQHNLANALRVIVLSFILSTAIGYSLADWAPPSGSPPNYNTPPPINVGPASQMRDGILFINNNLFAAKAQTQSTVPGDIGTTLTTKDYVDRKVGGGMKIFAGTGCGSCPYGDTNDGVQRYCSVKNYDGTIVTNHSRMNREVVSPACHWLVPGPNSPFDWSMWSY
jgi:hypothetical protein